ncbi:MAG: prolyl oligopeptidase family serine peptidase [Gemmataceae bacterium]
MKRFSIVCVVVISASLWAGLPAQDFAPPPALKLEAGQFQEIQAKTARLDKMLTALRRQGLRDPLLADVEVYHKAAVWISRHNEFYTKETADWTLAVLDRGLLRASQLAQGEAPWLQHTGYDVARAYRSRVDGSVQPYAVTLPADYGKDPRRKWRLDVVLHGRDKTLTEVKFLHQHNGDRAAAKGQPYVRLDIFGRTNNAYRWAGETDVFEALDNFLTVEKVLGRDWIDPRRVVLRGFSMGGAGTWHLGLHHPAEWCVLGPGAGFTTTRGYVKGLPNPLPPYQEACLRIYDAVDYAENVANVPVVAYSGDQDPQMQAAVNIENRLKDTDWRITHLIAPGLGHSFPPEWQRKAEQQYARFADPGRAEYPLQVRFVTYTLKYPRCDWVELVGLDRHYDKAVVDARRVPDGYTVTTQNVNALRIDVEGGDPRTQAVTIDDQTIQARPYVNPQGGASIYLQRVAGQWRTTLPQKLQIDQLRRPRKVHGLTGPIDDAFTEPFLCVRGTGQPWHEAVQRHAEANLKRFQDEWSKYLRGDLPVKDDVDVTEEDINTKHLILFGDPGSNALLAHVIDRLPPRWTREHITLNGKQVSAKDHVPALIYPSPLSARYVVLNSGHTFHAEDFIGTNALLYPRLGDFALLRLAPTADDPLAVEVVTAGLFDDEWQLPK